jgi:hypothetical protein
VHAGRRAVRDTRRDTPADSGAERVFTVSSSLSNSRARNRQLSVIGALRRVDPAVDRDDAYASRWPGVPRDSPAESVGRCSAHCELTSLAPRETARATGPPMPAPRARPARPLRVRGERCVATRQQLHGPEPAGDQARPRRQCAMRTAKSKFSSTRSTTRSVNERSSCSCGYLHATSSSTGAAQYRLRHWLLHDVLHHGSSAHGSARNAHALCRSARHDGRPATADRGRTLCSGRPSACVARARECNRVMLAIPLHNDDAEA